VKFGGGGGVIDVIDRHSGGGGGGVIDVIDRHSSGGGGRGKIPGSNSGLLMLDTDEPAEGNRT